MDLSPIHVVPRRRLLTVTGVTGIAYTLSWIAGLAVAAPSPKLTASGAQIATALAGHQTAVAVQFALTEGLPAAGLAIIAVALARAARRSGAAAAARAALIAGAAAALISLLQFVLGAVLAGTASPSTAHLLYDAVNRLDGVKMLALAVLALAGAASRVLPRWLRYTGIALAIAITASGIAYLLLLQGLAILAIPSGVLLLVFITGTGIVLGTSPSKPRATPCPQPQRPAVTRDDRSVPTSPGSLWNKVQVVAEAASVSYAKRKRGMECHMRRCPISSRRRPQSSAFPASPSVCGRTVRRSTPATA